MNFFEAANIISIYTRENALMDGVLHDVSYMAKEVGFKFPVAVSANVMAIINDIPVKYDYQSKEGRLYDVLFLAAINARSSKGAEIMYKLELPHYGSKNNVIKTTHLKALIGPGDNYEPVVTIMLQNED